MRLSVTSVLLLSAGCAASYAISGVGISGGGIDALQILSFLDQLHISVLDQLVATTNSTGFWELSKVWNHSLIIYHHCLFNVA